MREAFMDNSVMFSSNETTANSTPTPTNPVNSSPMVPTPLLNRDTFVCIITDMTDPTNTCKRHVINLPGSYSIEDLIQEAGNHYAYDPFTFCLMWKCHSGEMLNISEIQMSNLSLTDLGLKVTFLTVFTPIFLEY